MDFGDILNNLDFAAMAIGEARYDRYSIFSDIMYTKISNGSGTPRGIIAENVDVTSKTFAALLGAGYSVLQNDYGNLDVVAGLRVWHANTEISFSGGILDGVSREDSATWVDGLGGIRARYSITNKVYLTGWSLVGGGGANVDWDVAGAIGYSFNDKISAVAGYRHLASITAATASSWTSLSRDRSSVSSCVFELGSAVSSSEIVSYYVAVVRRR